MSLLGLIVAGAIIGALARLFMKGEQPMGTLITVVLGILGVIAGYYVSDLFGVKMTNGVDWLRWLISIVCSIVFISAYLVIMGRSKRV